MQRSRAMRCPPLFVRGLWQRRGQSRSSVLVFGPIADRSPAASDRRSEEELINGCRDDAIVFALGVAGRSERGQVR